ncbi:MAG: glycosyltransferase family 4 protein [Candidatus Kariarchaeaceae archaeon]|jgi:glycosyltransferase involved in cell wall biosynthesis
MNFAIIGPTLSSSGTSRHVSNMFQGLSEIVKGKLILISFREYNENLNEKKEIAKQYIFNEIPTPPFASFIEFITDTVQKEGITVLLPQIKPFILFCCVKAKFMLDHENYSIRIIGTWHSNFSWIIDSPYHLALAHMGISQCDGIIPVSKNVTDSLVKILQYDASKILPIISPGGIDFNLIHQKRPEILTSLRKQLFVTDKYIIFLGRLLYNKGVDILVAAFKELNFDGKLVIIGEGPYKNEFQQLIADYGLTEAVIFTGFMEDAEVYALLQGAEFYCLPSRWESFSISTLEAMAAGLPVICSRVGGLAQWTKDVAVQVESEDISGFTLAMQKVLDDQNYREVLSEKSIKLAKQYDFRELSKRTLESVQKILQQDTSHPLVDQSDKFGYNEETGIITCNAPQLFPNIPQSMLITPYALYFPSEAIENENKDVDAKIKYYQLR